MASDSLDQFDALVAALEQLADLNDGPEADAGKAALDQAPGLREQLAVLVRDSTRAEITGYR